MNNYFNSQFLLNKFLYVWEKISQTLFHLSTALNFTCIVFSLLLAFLLASPLAKKVIRLKEKKQKRHQITEKFLTIFPPLIKFILAIFFLAIGMQIIAYQEFDVFFLRIFIELLAAWTLINFFTGMLQNHNWTRMLSACIWGFAALHILGILTPFINLLDSLAISIGKIHLSVLLLGKAALLCFFMLKATTFISAFTEKRIYNLPELSPSVQVLLNKIVRISLFILAAILTLGVLGIDLSAFAFIGGAIGVGLGFGLQKVVSNLISGIILLLDRSIKPGDVIEIGSTYGQIKSLGARYVSVATRDNTEYLIPNEDLITNQVVNWSFSDAFIRLKIDFSVSYDSDVHQVIDLITTAALSIPRVLDSPKPSCYLKAFGDSSIDMELRIWICDPENGISNVKSAIRIAVWEVFKKHNIEIPYPHMDVYMRPNQ